MSAHRDEDGADAARRDDEGGGARQYDAELAVRREGGETTKEVTRPPAYYLLAQCEVASWQLADTKKTPM